MFGGIVVLEKDVDIIEDAMEHYKRTELSTLKEQEELAVCEQKEKEKSVAVTREIIRKKFEKRPVQGSSSDDDGDDEDPEEEESLNKHSDSSDDFIPRKKGKY